MVQESFHIMFQGQGLDGKGWRSYKKEVKNKEGKEEEGDGITFQESFHIMCQGQGLDGKG